MKSAARILTCFVFAFVALANADAASSEARVTQIIREVKVLPADAKPRAAELNERVADETGVRTGDRSRSELTFPDLTINRLGANTIFSFNRAGRALELTSGSVLLRVPKDSGGGSVRSPAVSVAVTGTTFILESARGGRSKLLVLEGSARLRLIKYPAQTREVRAGYMLDVPAGAKTLGQPTRIDLRRTLREHPLLAGFPPLPSQDLILAAADGQPQTAPDGEPVYEGRPVGGPLYGGPVGPGIRLPPPGLFPGSRNPPNTRNPGARNRGESSTQSHGEKARPTPRPKPTPSKPPGVR